MRIEEPKRRPKSWSSTPGKPSAERILRSTVAVSSASQSIARSRLAQRGLPALLMSLGRHRAVRRRLAARGRAPRARRLRRLRSLRCDTGCSCARRAWGTLALAQTGPASSSACACSTVTPQSLTPRNIAQSSAAEPRSPGGPGCTTRQRWRCQSEGGMARFKNGASMTSGCNNSTASRSPDRGCRVRPIARARRGRARRTGAATGC